MKFNGIELTVAILVRRIQRAAFNISVYLGVSSNRSPLARTQSVRLKTNSDRRYLTVQSGQKEMSSRKGLKLAHQNISSLLGNIWEVFHEIRSLSKPTFIVEWGKETRGMETSTIPGIWYSWLEATLIVNYSFLTSADWFRSQTS